MTDELFNIVFKGELVRSFELSDVKNNVSQLFKIDGPKLDALFSGKTIILKRNLNFDTATKYRVAIKKAGARVDMVPAAEENSQAATSEKIKTKPNVAVQETAKAPVEASSSSRGIGLAPPVTVLPEHESGDQQRAKIQAPSFDLAPAGADVLSASEKKSEPAASIDTSSLSVRESSGNLLDAAEVQKTEPVNVDTSAVSLSPQEGELLKPEEKKKVETVEVDVSGMSIAETGARLGEPSPPPPPAPDVSKIKLAP